MRKGAQVQWDRGKDQARQAALAHSSTPFNVMSRTLNWNKWHRQFLGFLFVCFLVFQIGIVAVCRMNWVPWQEGEKESFSGVHMWTNQNKGSILYMNHIDGPYLMRTDSLKRVWIKVIKLPNSAPKGPMINKILKGTYSELKGIDQVPG